MEQVKKEIEQENAEPAAAEKPAEAAPAPVEEAKPEAEPAAAAPAEGEKPAEGEEKPAPAAALPELDDGETIAPSDLAKFLNENPELKAIFDRPEMQEQKNRLFAMARRLEKGGKILQLIPNEAEAQKLIETSNEYQTFDEGIDKITDTKSGLEFFERLGDVYQVDDGKGNKVINPAFGHIRRGVFDDSMNYLIGKSEQSGEIHPVLAPAFGKMLDILKAKAEKTNDADVLTSINVLRDELSANSQPQRAEMTPEQKARDAELTRREQEITRRNLEEHQQKVTAAFDGVLELAAQSSVDQARPRIEKAGLSPAEAEQAYTKIGRALETELNGNGLYQQRLRMLRARLAKDPSQQNAQAIRDHIIEYQNLSLGRIITTVLREVTQGKVGRQETRDTKVAAQVDASRSEPRGVTAAPAAPKELTPADEHAESEKLWAKDNPDQPMPLSFHMDRMGKKIKAEIRATGR